MKIIKPSVEFVDKIDGDAILRKIEYCGRTCYKSEGDGTVEGTKKFVQGLINRGHESVLEHVNITVKIICDRGVSHELVRHRLASYSQESTRYCNYSKDKFGGELTFVEPSFWEENSEFYEGWQATMVSLCAAYLVMLNGGAKPEEARAILPNSLKTEVIMTANLREWRHILKLRTSKHAHPDMRRVMQMLLDKFRAAIPVIFDDIGDEKTPQERVDDAIAREFVKVSLTPKHTAPIPCHTDKTFNVKEWFAKLDEELNELKDAILLPMMFLEADIAKENRADAQELKDIAEEAADLITVVTSLQEAIGIDEEIRDKAQEMVNEKNKARGYC